ncbi:MAG TPA: polysaccharide biosynthesis tyrosine autokinase [Paludibacter sp.]|nr:polysaccharide biosynthesis tyrosine autokinase [Paludibacter sp.]
MRDYPDIGEEFEKPIDFLGIFIKYLSYWKWFLFSVAVCVLLGVLYIKFTLPSYQVTTTILLKDDEKGGGTAEINAFKEMGLFTQKNNVDNELEKLKTSSLVSMVVRDLGLNVTYTRLGTIGFLQKAGKPLGLDNLGKYKEKVLYGLECPVLVNVPEQTLENINGGVAFELLVHPYGEYEFRGNYMDKDFKLKSSVYDKQVTLPFGKVNLIRGGEKPKSDMLVEIVIQQPVNKADELLGSMKMALTSKTTSVVNIAFDAPNVRLGKDFLNKLIEVYNAEDLNDQMKMANKTAQFIDERLMTLTRDLGDVESQVENYKQVQGIADIKSQSDLFIKQTGDLGQKRLEIETQLAIVSDIYDYMYKKENKYQLLPSSTGIHSEGLNELIMNYNKLVLERNRLSRIASESNQAMVDLTNQIESMFSTVQSSVKNERNNLLIAQRDLLSKNSENSARIRAIPRQEREYTEIKRQQSVKEALYLFLLQKKEEKYVNTSMIEPVSKIIDNVRSSGAPVSPKKSMVLLVSLILGLVIPAAGIKVNDLLRYQIENKKDLEEISVVPILGEIPKNVQPGNSIIRENNTDTFTELIRLLRTNLLFVMDGTDKKVINVVSSISGEGKTFVAINLAMSLAMLEKKVLVMGLDVRKPKLADYLKIDNKTGVTLYLTGHLGIDQLIQPSGIHPNLSVILAGPIPPNPNELLAKPALDKLVKELRVLYDYIIIDTAPILVVSDSFTLNRFADVNLYVVRADYTPKKNIEDATNLYKHNKLNSLYFVLNGTDKSKYTYRYGSGKKYGYGYTKKHENKYGYNHDDKKKKMISVN